MGSSVVLVFAFPLLILEVFFNLIMGAIYGYPTTEIVLPYDESSGIVWEYDNIDDPYIKLIDTKIENGNQIFVFEGTNEKDIYNGGRVMELVFTDENGNEEVYYAYHTSKNYAPSIYSAEDCQLIEVTMTAENPVDGGEWRVSSNDNNYYLCEQESASETRTFTTVITPNNKRGEYNVFGKFDVNFYYYDSYGVPLEKVTVVYEFENGTHFVSEIKH